MFSVLLLQKKCADPYPRAQLKVPHVTRFFLWESLCSCSFEIVWATQGQGPHSCALLSKGTVLSDHVLDHRFLPCSCGEVGSLSTPLECGLALWLIFTSRLWQKWYCVTFLTESKELCHFCLRLWTPLLRVQLSCEKPEQPHGDTWKRGSSLPATHAKGLAVWVNTF